MASGGGGAGLGESAINPTAYPSILKLSRVTDVGQPALSGVVANVQYESMEWINGDGGFASVDMVTGFITILIDGWYDIFQTLNYAAGSGSGARTCYFGLGNTPPPNELPEPAGVIVQPGNSLSPVEIECTGKAVRFNAGDVIQPRVYQDSGVTITLLSTPYTPNCTVQRVG